MTHPSASGDRSEGHGLAAGQVGDEALIQRVRTRLMKQIAAESGGHHGLVVAGSGVWRPFLPGIERQVLHEAEGIMCYLLRFAPGATLPAHRHPADEECVVLQGAVRVGRQLLPAGSFQKVSRNRVESDTTSDEGAVIYLRGASPRPEFML